MSIEDVLMKIPEKRAIENYIYVYKVDDDYKVFLDVQDNQFENKYVGKFKLNKKEYEEYSKKQCDYLEEYWKYVISEVSEYVPEYIAECICEKALDSIEESVSELVYNENPRLFYRIVYHKCYELLREINVNSIKYKH